MRKVVLVFVLCAFFATPAMADLTTYGDIGTTALFGDGGASLQGQLDAITVGGPSSVVVTSDAILDEFDSFWRLVDSGTGSATMIIELGDYAGSNIFGLYDTTDSSKMAAVFDGSHIAGDTATVRFNLDGNVIVTNFRDGIFLGQVVGPVFAHNAFGFYLDSPDGMFYSDSTMNPDGNMDHLYAYQGKDDTIQLPGMAFPTEWTSGGFVLAWEDLWNGGDRDYEDMVLMVESIQPVPVPGAVLLGLLGLSVAGVKLRKYA